MRPSFFFRLLITIFSFCILHFSTSFFLARAENHVTFVGPKQPESKTRLADVVRFQVEKIEDRQKLEVRLTTLNNFRVYEENLQFAIVPAGGLSYPVVADNIMPGATPWFDPFYRQTKRILKNGTLFVFQASPGNVLFQKNGEPVKGILQISAQACSDALCLLPETLSLDLRQGAQSFAKVASSFLDPGFFLSETKAVGAVSAPSATPETGDKLAFFNETLAFRVQNALKEGSFWLFPILFLAGLLMNLTPCVYPMIPITLNVMSRFGKGRTLPLAYVGGMVVTYSALGVFAGMTGSVFGAQLASPLLVWVIAIVLLLLGLLMLGAFNVSFLQSFAYKIPLAQKYPHLAVGTMGAVSGLISAPCTGPVLSLLLILIAQGQNPVVGFVDMLFFALGFGSPYFVLGMISQRFSRLPRFPGVNLFIKIFFATLMFALSAYYLREFLQQFAFVSVFFARPASYQVALVLFFILFFAIFLTKSGKLGKFAQAGLVLAGFLASLWLTLSVTNTFILPPREQAGQALQVASKVHWQTEIKTAQAMSEKNAVPVLVDVWAQWCAACLEMDATTWQDKSLADVLNTRFVSLKLDYTHPSADVKNLLQRWGVAGLPAVAVFAKGVSLTEKPTFLFQGIVSTQKILETARGLAP